jgi:hypothetical protein
VHSRAEARSGRQGHRCGENEGGPRKSLTNSVIKAAKAEVQRHDANAKRCPQHIHCTTTAYDVPRQVQLQQRGKSREPHQILSAGAKQAKVQRGQSLGRSRTHLSQAVASSNPARDAGCPGAGDVHIADIQLGQMLCLTQQRCKRGCTAVSELVASHPQLTKRQLLRRHK